MGKTDFKLRFIVNYLSSFKDRPIDGVALTFLIVVSILTYLNGTYVLLPQVLVELGFPSVLIIVGRITTTWIVTAILSNIFLIRYRDSSIVHRLLLQPTVNTPTFHSFTHNPDEIIKEQAKSMGQHFMANPFGEEGNWHICATCEVFVPPLTWHCQHCKTCILRRDHHCIFAMACIGEENHCNFLGLLLYLAIGSSLATAVNILYTLMLTETPFWLFFLKAFIPFYTLLYDYSLLNMLSAVNFLGSACAWVVFINYIVMAFRSQTCIDALSKNGFQSKASASQPKYSYSNAEKFLGSNPIGRLFWPFHSALKNSYGPSQVRETRKEQ